MTQTQETALITGASRGIGKAVAVELAERDYKNLVLVALERDELKEAKNDLRSEYQFQDGWPKIIQQDLTAADAVDKLLNRLEEIGVQVDILVNNAGIGAQGRFSQVSPAKVKNLIRLNVEAVVKITRLILERMESRDRGKILNVGSIAGFQPVPQMATYASSKAFIRSFTNSLWYQTQESDVSVTGLYPGETKTTFRERIDAENTRLTDFSWLLSSPEFVAKCGVEGLINGKREVIPGLINRMLTKLHVFLPRRWVLYLADFLNQRV